MSITMASSSVQVLNAPVAPPFTRRISLTGVSASKYRIQDVERFVSKAEFNFKTALNLDTLQLISSSLQQRFQEACKSSSATYLPSFCHTLPTGFEQGACLALDVGGTNFRVALVELRGRTAGRDAMSTRLNRDFKIDNYARNLSGKRFFSWMADRILEAFAGNMQCVQGSATLPIGLSWSFPVEQISTRDGLLMPMGKGLRATEGLLGENLADLLTDACRTKGLNVDVQAIVNDSSSTLLSGAYRLRSSPIALILGTGLNASVHLPVTALRAAKYGDRPLSWTCAARHVLVNTEISLFGGKLFPLTRWDNQLKAGHSNPDFQPLEHLTSGRYLGEIVRLVLVDAIRKASLFGDATPANFQPYELTTETLAMVESDTSTRLSQAAAFMDTRHPLPGNRPYTLHELRMIRRVIEAVSTRAAAFLAASVHAIIKLRDHCESESHSFEEARDLVIGCNGSVVEKYPHFLSRVEHWLALLTGNSRRKVSFELTGESALSGAAVAVVCQQE